MEKVQKLLILDGIGGVPLGREIQESFVAKGIMTSYFDCATLAKIHFYRTKSAIAKLINRSDSKDEFYHLPRLSLAEFEKMIENENPSHVLVIGFIYKFIAPDALLKLKTTFNFSLYLYDTDSCNLYSKRREFIFFLDKELPVYDAIFSFSKVTTHFFQNTRGLNARHLPFGAKPIPNKQLLGKKYDVLFVGSADLRRIFLLEHIKEYLTVYGSRWQRNFPLISTGLKERITDKSLWGEGLHECLRQSKIVLNITRAPFYSTETGVNLRIFEALAAGCFLLTDACEEVTELFEVGVEIETYSNATELKHKVQFYLENPEKREAIAKNGHDKLMKMFTWDAKVEELRQLMNLNASIE